MAKKTKSPLEELYVLLNRRERELMSGARKQARQMLYTLAAVSRARSF